MDVVTTEKELTLSVCCRSHYFADAVLFVLE